MKLIVPAAVMAVVVLKMKRMKKITDQVIII
jgi:hypothetical protein